MNKLKIPTERLRIIQRFYTFIFAPNSELITSNFKKYLPLFLMLFLWTASHAQDISLNATVDKSKVAMNDELVLSVVISGNVNNLPQPKLPPLDGFSIVSSRNSQNFSIINGAVSATIEYSYVLAPAILGQHTIGEISVDYQGKTLKSTPIKVEVTQSQSQGVPQQPVQPGQQANVPAEKIREIFITTVVDKKTAYVGEQITIILRLFNSARLLSQPQGGFPDTTGFISEDLPPQKNYYTDINGRRYVVNEIKRALIPTLSGKYTIGQAQVQCVIADNSGGSPDDIFRNFFGGGKTIVLKSDTISINVPPLPSEGKPSDFSGAVGNFQISAKVDKTEGKMNEAITIEVTIFGTGNVKSIGEPNLGSLTGFRKYDTLSSVNATNKDYRLQGSKSFKTIIIPKVTGKITIPSITYSFFNPATKSYHRINTNPISLNILPGPKEEQQSAQLVAVSQEGIKYIGSDIRHIKPGNIERNYRESNPLIARGLFVSLQFLPLLCLGGALLYRSRSEKLSKDIGYARFTFAYKDARKNLIRTKKLIQSDAKQFYGNMANVFTEYLADKLNLSFAGLTLNILVAELNNKGVKQEIIDRIRELWQEFDFLRFAPSGQSDTASMEAVFKKTEDFIVQFEKNL